MHDADKGDLFLEKQEGVKLGGIKNFGKDEDVVFSEIAWAEQPGRSGEEFLGGSGNPGLPGSQVTSMAMPLFPAGGKPGEEFSAMPVEGLLYVLEDTRGLAFGQPLHGHHVMLMIIKDDRIDLAEPQLLDDVGVFDQIAGDTANAIIVTAKKDLSAVDIDIPGWKVTHCGETGMKLASWGWGRTE
jgi:hypothetical protein